MDVLDNAFLQRAYKTASDAIDDGTLSGEDTVMHVDSETGEVSGHQWVRLGKRSDDFKASNARMRERFFENLLDLFGGRENIDKLPKEMRDALKLDDFKLNGNESTSDRPLTARRIVAICKMAAQWKENKINTGKWQKMQRSADGKAQLKAEVRKLAFAGGRDATVCEVKAIFDRMLGRGDRVGDLRMVRDLAKASRDVESKCLGEVKEKLAKRPAKEQCIVFMRLAEHVDAVGKSFVQGLRGDPASWLEDYWSAIGDSLKNFDYDQEVTQEQLAKLSDDDVCGFLRAHVEMNREKYQGVAGAVNKDLRGDKERTKYDNLIEGIEIRDKLLSDSGIGRLLRQSVKDAEFFSGWYKAEQKFHADDKNKGKTFDDAEFVKRYNEEVGGAPRTDKEVRERYETYHDRRATHAEKVREHDAKVDEENAKVDVENAEIEKRNQEIRKWNANNKDAIACGMAKKRPLLQPKARKKKYEGPECPSVLTRSGSSAGERIHQELGMSSHASINTAQQMLDAYEVVTNIGDLFLKCLDRDRENGNTAMFDKLMTAMDMPGCMQARSEPLLELKAELEIEVDLGVKMASSKQPLSAGIGNKIFELYNEGGKAVAYDALVSGYLKAIGVGEKGGATEIELDDIFLNDLKNEKNGGEKVRSDFLAKYGVPGKTTVGVVGKPVVVKVSEELLRESVIRGIVFENFGGYVEA